MNAVVVWKLVFLVSAFSGHAATTEGIQMGFSALIATTPPNKCILIPENLVCAAAISECTTNLERKKFIKNIEEISGGHISSNINFYGTKVQISGRQIRIFVFSALQNHVTY